MNLMKMPMFTWSAFIANVIIVFAFPVLTVALAMGTMDRLFGTNFFTIDKWRYGYALGKLVLGLGTS